MLKCQRIYKWNNELKLFFFSVSFFFISFSFIIIYNENQRTHKNYYMYKGQSNIETQCRWQIMFIVSLKRDWWSLWGKKTSNKIVGLLFEFIGKKRRFMVATMIIQIIWSEQTAQSQDNIFGNNVHNNIKAKLINTCCWCVFFSFSTCRNWPRVCRVIFFFRQYLVLVRGNYPYFIIMS